MIVSELVFSVLDISLWIKFPETVVEFASPKKIGHSSVPKKTPGIVVFGSQPVDPPPAGHGNPHTARDHFGERSRSRCFLAWELKTRQQKRGDHWLCTYTRKLTGWKIQHEWSLYVLLKMGDFLMSCFFLLGCMVYLALRFNSWPLENDGTRSYFPGGTPYIECLWYQDYLVRAIGDTGL